MRNRGDEVHLVRDYHKQAKVCNAGVAFVVDQDVSLESSKRATGRAIEEFEDVLPLDPRGPYPGCVNSPGPYRHLPAAGVHTVIIKR